MKFTVRMVTFSGLLNCLDLWNLFFCVVGLKSCIPIIDLLVVCLSWNSTSYGDCCIGCHSNISYFSRAKLLICFFFSVPMIPQHQLTRSTITVSYDFCWLSPFILLLLLFIIGITIHNPWDARVLISIFCLFL